MVNLSSPNFQEVLFEDLTPKTFSRHKSSSTFIDNMKLPIHRWIRFSAGFSAAWAETVLASTDEDAVVLDPFAGSGTTLIAAETVARQSYGIEAHPFVYRIAKAKLQYRSHPDPYLKFANKVARYTQGLKGQVEGYPPLIRQCFNDDYLSRLDRLRRAWERFSDESPQADLVWITLLGILREVSHAGTCALAIRFATQIKNHRSTRL